MAVKISIFNSPICRLPFVLALLIIFGTGDVDCHPARVAGQAPPRPPGPPPSKPLTDEEWDYRAKFPFNPRTTSSNELNRLLKPSKEPCPNAEGFFKSRDPRPGIYFACFAYGSKGITTGYMNAGQGDCAPQMFDGLNHCIDIHERSIKMVNDPAPYQY